MRCWGSKLSRGAPEIPPSTAVLDPEASPRASRVPGSREGESTLPMHAVREPRPYVQLLPADRLQAKVGTLIKRAVILSISRQWARL